ncbi:hypothetical protein EBR03_06200 [bacterium]|nr:hypothetical protein [bacterium]
MSQTAFRRSALSMRTVFGTGRGVADTVDAMIKKSIPQLIPLNKRMKSSLLIFRKRVLKPSYFGGSIEYTSPHG